MSELTKRILFAAFAIPVAIFIILGSELLFAFFIILVSSLALYEYYKMARNKGYFPNIYTGLSLGVIFQAGFYYYYTTSGPQDPFLFLFAALLFSSFIILLLELWSNKLNAIANTAVTLTGLIYITFSFLSLIAFKSFNIFALSLTNPPFSGMFNTGSPAIIDGIKFDINWGLFILTIFGAIWLCDSAAYFTGKSLGKHKLFPRHSPKKTWEGAIGGFISSVIAFPVLSYFFNPELALQHTIISGVIVGIFGQTGDLVESQFKRDAGVKDSSNILPGHGGILDRFDSIIFVAPLIYLYFLFFFI